MASSLRIDELRQKFEENPRRYFAPLANEYRKAGEIDQAIAICREYLPQQPGHMSGHIVYGQAFYEAKQFEEQFRPLLAKHCVECHSGNKPKGNLRLDNLAPNFADAASREHWLSDSIGGSVLGYGLGRVFWQSAQARHKDAPRLMLSPQGVAVQWQFQ